MKTRSEGNAVAVRFFMPSPDLAPYISTFYLTEVQCPDGSTIEDYLHPEWGNVRFSRNDAWQAAVGPEPLRTAPQLIVSGPSSQASRFVTGAARIWGIGILPLGWSRLFNAPASDLADRFCAATDHPDFGALIPLGDSIFGGSANPAAEAARIDTFVRNLLKNCPPREDEVKIRAAHAALIDPGVSTVSELSDRIGISARSLERLSQRVFGFPPKLLLRRQRFLRSLAQFMVDPSLKWVTTLDCQYVDQAHFVRDFKRFMGMSPSAYAALDHPVLRAAARARLAAAGEAVQALHAPA